MQIFAMTAQAPVQLVPIRMFAQGWDLVPSALQQVSASLGVCAKARCAVLHVHAQATTSLCFA